jgi:CHAT domain-containing protein/Tfp pilus assembly protein PilF
LLGFALTAQAEVTVLRVPEDPGAGAADLDVGDRILAASFADETSVPIDHPMDLEALAFGRGRLTAIRFLVADDDGGREVALPVGAPMPWSTSVDPARVAEADAALREALESDGPEAGSEAWVAAIGSSPTPGISSSPRSTCWVALHRVRRLIDSDAIEAATREAGRLGDVCADASLRDSVVARAAAAWDLREAAEDTDAIAALLESARADAEGLDPLLQATLDHDLGRFLGRRGRLDAAEIALDRAISAYAEIAPQAWGYADSLANRAIVDAIRGRLDAARMTLEDVLERIGRIAPDSLALSSAQANLAIVLRRLGELDAAEAMTESALAIRQRLAPGSEMLAQTLNNLGVLAKVRSDLVAAEDYYQRALAIREARGAPSLARASVLGNLANLALERLDPDASLARHRDVLTLLEPVAPQHRMVVNTHLSLGQGELLRGQFDDAEQHLHKARELQERIGTEAPIYAAILETLGRLARERGDPVTARDLMDRALELRLAQDPEGLNAAAVKLELARLDLADGLMENARRRLDESARLAAQRAPGSLVEARARHLLARLLWTSGEPHAALAEDLAALDAFEGQRERLGGDWLQRMRFGASHRDLYLDAIERQLAAGRVDQAFVVQERYRAYERRRLLAGRVALPAIDPMSTSIDQLTAELAVEEAILSWVVDEEVTHAFLLTASGLSVQTLPRGERGWREDLDSLGVLLSLARPSPEQREALSRRARELHAQLIAPWQPSLHGLQRLVLVPDQSLHRLPYAVVQEASSGRYLIEQHELVYAASASIYLASADASTEWAGVVAVGDPDPVSETNARVGPSGSDPDSNRDRASAPLPAARAEVQAIADLFPDRTLRLVGSEATEARVLDAIPEASLLHLAAHAVVDGARPLDAYIQLTPDAETQNDGRLAAWEVLTRLKLDADLVTLSACSTARGRTLGGDGVLGLSQAFQLAGARAVMATLWDVPDQATADLMADFYRRLAAGQNAAGALRLAQLEAMSRQRSGGPSGFWQRLGLGRDNERDGSGGPFEWAAFKLDGRVSSQLPARVMAQPQRPSSTLTGRR